MLPFNNEVIPINTLPKFEEAEMNPVQKKYWTVTVINFLIVFFIIGGILTGFSFIPDMREYKIYIMSGYLILMLIGFLLQKMAFEKKSYALRERDIIYRHGILATTTTIIPFTRIQHVAVHEGFISRYYKLAQLQIYTAGGSSSDLKISGLSKDDAEKIKEVIMLHIKNKDEGMEKRNC